MDNNNWEVTPDLSGYKSRDAGFGSAFIDIDEWREKPAPHRYIHGGFNGNHTRFSFYLPTPDKYRQRLLQYLEGGSGGNENVLSVGVFGPPWQLSFAFEELGAVLVESNQGHGRLDGAGFGDPILLHGASAGSAHFAKWLAKKIYGAAPLRAYIFGESGGGHRTIQCLMGAPDVYDGGVPEVVGVSPTPYWSAMANAIETIGPKIKDVIDALEPGGSDDPFVTLDAQQRQALSDLFRLGYPRRAANQLYRFGVYPFSLYGILHGDPDYFRKFWEEPGYLGADNPQALDRYLIDVNTTITGLAPAEDLFPEEMLARRAKSAGASSQTNEGVTVDYPHPDKLFMTRLTITSGNAKGREMIIANIRNGKLVPFGQFCPQLFNGVEPGDTVHLGNRDWVAYLQYFKHAVSNNVPALGGPDTPVIAEYASLALDGRPIFPQTKTPGYDLDHLKNFPGKMILIGATLDAYIWPTKITPMDRMLRQTLGANAEQQYRLWWVENATHAAPMLAALSTPDTSVPLWYTRLVDYDAVAAQALRDVVAWVEQGKAPHRDSSFALSRDNELSISADPKLRGGVQPIISAAVNGVARVDVRVGELFTLEGFAQAPADAGTIVAAAWDVDGNNTWRYACDTIDGHSDRVNFTAQHAYNQPGTYFPSFRAASHPQGASGRLPIPNIARVRVVVTA